MTVPIATDREGFSFNYEAMVASALNKPSEAGSCTRSLMGLEIAWLPGFPYLLCLGCKSMVNLVPLGQDSAGL